MNTKQQKLLERYEYLLRQAEHARRPSPFLNRADEVEDQLLALAERDPSTQDRIIPVIEARYRALGLI